MGMESFCGYCGRAYTKSISQHRCAVCHKELCPFCAKRKGGFLGIFGGYEVCPYCLKHES